MNERISFTALTFFGLSRGSFNHIELSESHGGIIVESSFDSLLKNVNATAVNLRGIIKPETNETMDDGFSFAVPEPFGSMQHNMHNQNQKATPVFRQNCFMFEAPLPSKGQNRFPKKLAPKRLSKGRSMRI